jgi:1-acyl-sn-glycerol-3-phosphate acyltransferase
MKILSATIKLIFFFMTIISYFSVSLIFYSFLNSFPHSIRKVLTYLIHIHAKLLVWILQIKIDTDDLRVRYDKSSLIVSNHLSYLDILVIASVYPTCFVTSTEIRDIPFLGHICKLGGCVFVNRRNKKNINNEIKEISDALANNLNVLIFPEATSTNGEEVIRFRRPLFTAAKNVNAPILPLCLNYTHVNGQQLTRENRDKVFWYGEMTFFSHFWGVMELERISTSLIIANSFQVSDFEDVAMIASHAHQQVSSYYNCIA